MSPQALDHALQALQKAGWRRAGEAPKTTFEYSKDVQLVAPRGGMLELHFGYSADFQARMPSSKLKALVELVGQLREEGHRALVFSQFTSHLALVREALEEEGVKLLYLELGAASSSASRRAASCSHRRAISDSERSSRLSSSLAASGRAAPERA